ncbi:MAG: hypothetical protein ABEJ34_05010 [Haloferacaceae archaeon]
MAFELGFLVGSLALLALVLYFTRVRGPSVPHAGNVDELGDAEGGTRAAAGPETEVCEICERERVCSTEGGLTVCAECNDDLLA